MKHLTMDGLRAFVTVLDLGGFTQAGELLGRTQPAISQQVKKLEQQVGRTLLVRRGQNVELSQEGQLFLPYAKKILALQDEAIEQFSRDGLAGKVRLGIPSEFATSLLPKIVGLFSQAYPNVTLEVTCDLSKHLLHETRRYEFDLILGLYADASQVPARERIKLDELVWVGSSEHQHRYVSQPVPLIVAPKGCIYRERAEQHLSKAGIAWRVLYTNPDLAGIRSAIEEGLGVTVLARSTVPDNLSIIRSGFPKLGNMAISLVTPQPDPTQAVDRLAEYLTAALN